MPPPFAAQLAQLTGLATQLLPVLDGLTSEAGVVEYLSSLLAPGPQAQSFTKSYISHRFPSPAAPAVQQSTRRWGASPSPSASAPSSGGPSRAPTPHQTKEELQQAFGGAGAGGRVYVKEREDADAGGWGGGGGKKAPSSAAASRASSSSRPAAAAAAPALAPPVPVVATAKGKAREKQQQEQKRMEEDGVELSEEAVAELKRIERALKGFQGGAGKKDGERREKRCFCAARLHPLSPFAPSCPSCALPLCALNAPSSPCPSCAHTPLLPPSLSASHIATLTSSREALLAREKERARREKEQRERERAAIRFPELGADYSGVERRNQSGGYAAHAGGRGGLQDRIQGTYPHQTERVGVSEQKAPPQAQAAGKVLRLGANGKVKVQTKKLVPSRNAGGKARLQEQTIAVVDPASSDSEEDGLPPFIDEDDDGLRVRSEHERPPRLSARAEREGWAEERAERGWERVTLPQGERPRWVAPEVGEGEGYSMDVEPDEDDDDEGGAGGKGKARQEEEREREAVAVGRPAVPGAAVVKPGEGGEKKGRRRGRGKGEKGGEKKAGGGGEEKNEGGWAE
ncbi:hypothetical protein JCM10213v2_008571 [Rhodosporidiobolus nylandii]